MKRYSIRQDGKRFGVEALCLLMVLYGAPIQALQQAGPIAVAENSTETGLWSSVVEGVESAITTLAHAAVGAAADARAETVETAQALVGQPWTDALSILLATAAGEEEPPSYLTDAVAGPSDPRFDAVPPLPPGFREGPVSRRAGIPGLAATAETVLASKDHLEAIPLLAGWNLLSIPEEPADPDPAVVLAPIGGSFDRVFAYDACDPGDPWKLFDPADAAASDLLDLDPTQGLWLRASGAASLPSAGTLAPTTSWQLCTGWNLIGYPAGEPRHVRNALQSIEGKYLRVFGFDLADPGDAWEVWDVTAPDWANDLVFLRPGFGYWVLVTEDVTLEIANQGDVPTVAITTPTDLAEITAPTEIRGTIQSPILESWNLAYRLVGEPEWIELASGAFPVTDAPLATFDPTLLLNGLYEIRLEAVDIVGMAVDETIAVSVEGNMKIGHFSLTYLDFSIPLSGLDLDIIRTYDSRERLQRDFGVGWTLDIRQGSYRNNRPPGFGWQITDGLLPCQSVLETRSHLTTVRLSDREIYRFRFSLTDTAPTLGGCFARPIFQYVEGPVPATLEALGDSEVFYSNASNQVVHVDTQEVYEPDRVRLTTYDGRVFDFDLAVGAVRLEDTNGNELTLSDDGIRHSSGQSIDFNRDAEGRIVEIVDPVGNSMTYTYDGAGDLVSVLDAEGNATRFTYSDHYLEEIEDARGIVPLRNEYDEAGRLVRHIDAAGRAIEYDHDLDARKELVTDRLGQTREVEYDGQGNLIREVDEAGGETLRTFDARGNRLSETDPEGRTSQFVYDASNQLVEVRDALGNVERHTYDGGGRILTTTDPAGGATTNTYDGRGNLLTTTDPTGAVTTYAYDAQGRVVRKVDALGGESTYAYDGFGNGITTIAADGQRTDVVFDGNGNRLRETTTRTVDGQPQTLETVYTYDRLNRQTSVTYPDGTSESLTYDALGNLLQSTDELGRVTRFVYDGFGRPIETVFPDGLRETITYDFEGRKATETDRAGRVTRFQYDALDRLVSTEHPDGAVETRRYDRAGVEVAVTDARGFETTYALDGAGRRIGWTDALGNAFRWTLDAVGNRTTFTDARGAILRFEYDGANRLTKTTFPDTTERRVEYDPLGRPTRWIDAAGQETQLEYDPVGRLAAVEDSLEGRTTYAYDEVGNRIERTDAAGRTTRMRYDHRGRLVAQTLPDGSTETLDYDAVGNPVQRVRFDGSVHQLTYDDRDRLVTKTLPGNLVETYTYTATDQRASVVDARGTTQYVYDARDRLVELTDPLGRRLESTYDLAGNRLSRAAVVGPSRWTTSYSWDALGRLASVTDPEGEVYTQTYDPNGNRSGVVYPNGVETSYQYDSSNRLVDLTTSEGGGAVLQSYAYDLGPSGNRTRVEEHDGTVRSFTYDALYRLVGEEVTAPGGATVAERAWTWDAVGNRTQQTIDTGTGATTTSYSHDVRDRLLSASGTTYDWDTNGRRTRSSGADGVATLTFDAQDRLLEATSTDGWTVRHTYDVDGRRVSTTTTDADDDTARVDALVDPSGDLSEVVLTTDGAGQVLEYFVRGDDLLAVIRSSERRYYHQDGLGSVRILTAEDGTVSDRYEYSAFGELVAHQGDDDNPYLFAGQRFEPVAGLYDLRARWMDPSLGIMTSMDPFMGTVFDPVSLHKYLYAGADPINKTDPSGMFLSASEAVLVGAIIGLLVTQIITQNMQLTFGERLLILFVGAALGAALGALYAGAVGVSALSGTTAAGAAGAATASAPVAQRLVQFNWARAGHIFRNSSGHVNPVFQTTKERFARLFELVGSNPANLRPNFPLPPGAQQAGVQVYTQTFRNGQVWVQVRGAEITNAGVNTLQNAR